MIKHSGHYPYIDQRITSYSHSSFFSEAKPHNANMQKSLHFTMIIIGTR